MVTMVRVVEIDTDAARHAIGYAHATYVEQAPLAEQQGGFPMGIDDLEAAHAYELVAAAEEGAATDVQIAYLGWLIEYWGEEERQCLSSGLVLTIVDRSSSRAAS